MGVVAWPWRSVATWCDATSNLHAVSRRNSSDPAGVNIYLIPPNVEIYPNPTPLDTSNFTSTRGMIQIFAIDLRYNSDICQCLACDQPTFEHSFLEAI